MRDKCFIYLIALIAIWMQFDVKAQNNNEWKSKVAQAIAIGDENEMFKWNTEGAELGDMYAQGVLALCYLKGEGTEQNYEKAEYWAKKSAEQGYAYMQSLLGTIYCRVKNDFEQGVYWLEKAVNNGDYTGIRELASRYFNGEGVQKDVKKAWDWVERGAENGDVDAMVALADAYTYGDKGLDIDYTKALQWYDKSMATGKLSAEYIYNAGHMYQTGMGTDINLKKAFELFSKSAELKCAQAYNDLAYFYAKGEVVPQNFDIAIDMLDEAISLEPSSSRTCNFYDSKGEILLMQNKIDEAIGIWNKIKQDFPDQLKEMSDSKFIKSIKAITNEK